MSNTIGLIPHNGEYPFYTNTLDHTFQVIVKNEIGEQNTITKVGYFDGSLTYHEIGQVTNPDNAVGFAARYLTAKAISNATIILERLAMR